MASILTPGAERARGVADDGAVVRAMVRAETAWVKTQAEVGALAREDAEALTAAFAGWEPDLARLSRESESAGNAAVPLAAQLRAASPESLRPFVHRGLTSQDVLDTALVLMARDALARTRGDLIAAARALAVLAHDHRGSVMPGRTLTQHAVPITFGLKAARWLAGVLDALEVLNRTSFPVQCGGAAGTLSRAAELADPTALAEAFAHELGLEWPGLPWHTNRSAVVRIADAVAAATDALGVIASDVALLSRPEIGEVREGPVAGRGGSSTMPHKQNPVLAVLVRANALQVPQLLAQLHVASVLAVDERPDGSWHTEWPALSRLLELAVVASSQGAELVAGLHVDADAMRAHAEAAAEQLLAESSSAESVDDYLGASWAFIDRAVARAPGDVDGHA